METRTQAIAHAGAARRKPTAQWRCRTVAVSRSAQRLLWSHMSKKTKKRKARMRRSKANHGKRPNMGRR
jgi:hypothetical protein